MYDAQYLITKSGARIKVYSPWFPRGGAHARFVVDIVSVEDATLTVKAWTKNSEDAGDSGTEIATTTALDTPTQHAFQTTSAAEEMVRFTFTALRRPRISSRSYCSACSPSSGSTP